jgi:S1-C subfamily serine protease
VSEAKLANSGRNWMRGLLLTLFALWLPLTAGRAAASGNGIYDCFEMSSRKALARMIVENDRPAFWATTGQQYIGGPDDRPGWFSFDGVTTSGQAISAEIGRDNLIGSIRLGTAGRLLDSYAYCKLVQQGPPTTAGKEPHERVGSTGTGFFVSPNGLLVTSAHVIDGAEAVSVRYGLSELPAQIVASNLTTDLAVLKVDTQSPNFLTIAPPRSARVGQAVFTYGYPVSSLLGTEPKFTDGTISALSGLEDDPTFLQMSVPVQPGNSGGPLVNDWGEVLGVIAAQAAVMGFYERTGTLPQGVNWSVKAEYAALMIDLPPARPKTPSREAAIERVGRSIALIEAH